MNDLDKSIARITDTYAAAVLAKDITTFMRLYDPDVRVYDAWGVWQHDGRDAWQRTVEAWFGSLGTERVKARFDDARVYGNADCAGFSATVMYTGVSAEGAALRSMQNRLTWTLRTSGHVLRIVHEHTSAPVGFEDLKAILQRAPA